MELPSDHLCVFLLGLNTLLSSKFLFNELPHFLERCMFDNISSLSVEDLASKQSPEHLEHQFRVLLLLIDKDLFQGEKFLFSIFVFALFIQDLGILVQAMAIFKLDILFFLKALKCESVLISELLEIWSCQDIEQL